MPRTSKKKQPLLRRDVIESEEKKHLALWLSVGGVMALIVAMWIMLIPGQMREMALFDSQDAARWREVSASMSGDPSVSAVRESFDKLKGTLSDIKDRGAPQPAAAAVLTPDKIEELRKKIEEKNTESAPLP